MEDTPATRMAASLAAIWQRNRPQTLERLALLDRAAAAVPLSPALQAEATVTAHKLAGTLGMFGFAQGTELARALELELEREAPDQVRLAALTNELRKLVFPEES